MSSDLTGQRTLITGAGRGIGAAMARLLAQRGATVVPTDRDEAAVADIAAELGVRGLALDVADMDAWRVVDEATGDDAFALGVLNAGIGHRANVLDLTDEDIDRMVRTNLMGVMRGTVALARSMAARGGGSIAVTASLGGLVPHPQSPIYAAAKWGTIGWVRSVAPALAEHGVRINAVAPALVDTPILGPGTKEMLEGWGMRLLSGDDVAEALLHALTFDGTGEVFAVQVANGITRVEPLSVDGYQSGPGAGGPPPGVVPGR